VGLAGDGEHGFGGGVADEDGAEVRREGRGVLDEEGEVAFLIESGGAVGGGCGRDARAPLLEADAVAEAALGEGRAEAGGAEGMEGEDGAGGVQLIEGDPRTGLLELGREGQAGLAGSQGEGHQRGRHIEVVEGAGHRVLAADGREAQGMLGVERA